MKIILNIKVDKLKKDDLEELNAFVEKLNAIKECRPIRMSSLIKTRIQNKQRT